MSGGSVPYHLRQNKAIDRNLFIELLIKINSVKRIQEYWYIGFGGPYLEDFKIIHSQFGNKKLISIEEDINVFRRQEFNLPLGYIDCMRVNSGEFIDQYNHQENAIVWLDYASPKKLGEQLKEIQTLLPKLKRYDILKVTFNANPESLGNPPGKTAKFKKEKRLHKFKSLLGENFPNDVNENYMDVEGVPVAICKALKYSANKAMKGCGDDIFQPLTAFSYADSNHQMLTVTGIIIPEGEVITFLKETLIEDWTLACKDWNVVKNINIPELTVKERNFIDSRLPEKNEQEIMEEMEFCFDPNKARNAAYLQNYIEYYRHFPYFSKIVI